MLIPVAALYIAIMYKGYPPLLTNSVSFDAKVEYAQQRNIRQANVMALGSSMTLNNISSRVMVDSLDTSYFNFSCWGLQMADTRLMAVNYVPKYKPRYVLICSSLPDFSKPENTATYKNYFSTDDYWREHWSGIFYFKNYNSLWEIIARKMGREEQARNGNIYNSLSFDDGGGVLLDVPKDRISESRWNEQFTFPNNYTNNQYQELALLSNYLKKNQVKLVFVQAPIKESFILNSSSQDELNRHFNRCRNIVEQNGGVYMNYHDPALYTNDLFVDQFHLSETGATMFTRQITHQLKNNLLTAL
ncbi:hypothetical protein FLA_6217 [Filimonas lacunae]|nr:hypothetical protein FLA_6217 [Filimonas lacunae]